MATAFIEVDKPFYFAGDTVQGNIYFNLFSNMAANQVLVKFKGWESVRWFEQRIVPEHERPMIQSSLIFNSMFKIRMDSSDSQDHPGQDQFMKYKYVVQNGMLKEIIRLNGERQIARFDQVLHNFGGSFIPAGQYSFPFSFKTGENYPASYIDKSPQNNRRGRIKYEMQAFVRGFNSSLMLIRCKQEIVIRESAPIKNDQQQMIANVKSCCCIDQGITKIQCFFEKNAYTPGQDAKMYCKIDNTQGKTEVRSVDVALVNQITYTSNEGVRKVFNSQLFRKSFSGLGIGEQGERDQVVQIISTQVGNNAKDIKPTARGNKLHSVYFLVVEAVLGAACTCCSNLPLVKQPILIYPFIPIDYNFKAPPNWHPTIMPMINLQMGLSSLGVKMNVNMPSMTVNMPVPQVTMNVPTVSVNMPVPSVQMTVNSPSIHANMNSPSKNGQMHIEMGNIGGMGVSTNMNTGIGMSTNMNTGGGMSTNINTGMGGMHTNVHMGGMHTNMHVGGGIGGGVHTNVKMNGGVGMGFGGGMNVKMGF